MSIERRDEPLKVKADRGRMRVLAVMALYLVLTVAVGVTRSQWQASAIPAVGATPHMDAPVR